MTNKKNKDEIMIDSINKFKEYENTMEEYIGNNDIFKAVNKNIADLKEKIKEVGRIVSSEDENIDSITIQNLYFEIVMLLNDTNIEKLLSFKDFLYTERKLTFQSNFYDTKIEKNRLLAEETKKLNDELYDEYLFDLTEKFKVDTSISKEEIEELAIIKVMNDKKSEKNSKRFTDKEIEAEAYNDKVKVYMKIVDFVNAKYENMKRTISMGYRSLELLKSLFGRKNYIEKDKNI